jgi:hypothetical protein
MLVTQLQLCDFRNHTGTRQPPLSSRLADKAIVSLNADFSPWPRAPVVR